MKAKYDLIAHATRVGEKFTKASYIQRLINQLDVTYEQAFASFIACLRWRSLKRVGDSNYFVRIF